jgi:hypothetical protein
LLPSVRAPTPSCGAAPTGAFFVTGATLLVDGSEHDGTKPPQMYR